MPMYEYACEECRHRFGALRPMNEADAPIQCEQCGGRRTRRKLSLFNARSGGKAVAGTSGQSCGGCSGGTCGTCGQSG
jgi:putative FmdB family regulatory protein